MNCPKLSALCSALQKLSSHYFETHCGVPQGSSSLCTSLFCSVCLSTSWFMSCSKSWSTSWSCPGSGFRRTRKHSCPGSRDTVSPGWSDVHWSRVRGRGVESEADWRKTGFTWVWGAEERSSLYHWWTLIITPTEGTTQRKYWQQIARINEA